MYFDDNVLFARYEYHKKTIEKHYLYFYNSGGGVTPYWRIDPIRLITFWDIPGQSTVKFTISTTRTVHYVDQHARRKSHQLYNK